MREVPKLSSHVRAIAAAGSALLLFGALASCGKNAAGKSAAGPLAPSIDSVSHGRFVTTVVLGHGALRVTPPTAGSKAILSESAARTMFESANAAQGTHDFAILGLGVATLTTPTPSSEEPGAGTSPANSSANGTTTSAAATSTPTSTSTTGALPTTTTTTPLPVYDQRLAWIGITWGGPQTCPGTGTSGAKLLDSNEYVAVLMDADTGHDVVAYTSTTGTSCSSETSEPSVVRPDQLVSVPWHPVGPDSTAVSVTVPPCGSYDGWTQVVGTTSQPAVQVVASVPFDPTCAASAPESIAVDDVVPLGSAQSQLPHAALGPVDELKVLPGG